MPIHDKLICPHCGARKDKFMVIPDGVHIWCKVCKRETAILNLRCAVEPVHRESIWNSRKGYNARIAPTSTELRDIEKRKKEINAHNKYAQADLNDPDLRQRRFENYVKNRKLDVEIITLEGAL